MGVYSWLLGCDLANSSPAHVPMDNTTLVDTGGGAGARCAIMKKEHTLAGADGNWNSQTISRIIEKFVAIARG